MTFVPLEDEPHVAAEPEVVSAESPDEAPEPVEVPEVGSAPSGWSSRECLSGVQLLIALLCCFSDY